MQRIGVMTIVVLLVFIGAVQAQDTPAFDVDVLEIEVLNEYPHDPDAFTQGFVYSDGMIYESTGRYGESTLRSVEIETGAVIRNFDVPEEIFAEGLALVDDRLYQISWREQVAIVYELETGLEANTFEPLGVFQYQGEGWGLCYDGEALYMSDGSPTIAIRDPETFQAIGSYRVTLYGVFVDEINELECVGDELWMNVWNTDTILRADKATGIVTGVIDASSLLTPEERAGLSSSAVLNGIAYNPDDDVFYITGKLWEKVFEVRFVSSEG